MVGLSFLPLTRCLTTNKSIFIIIIKLCVTIYLIVEKSILLPRVARLMLHPTTAIKKLVRIIVIHLIALYITIAGNTRIH